MSTILWCCPNCGSTLKLRERVTQTKRKCSQCAEPITTEEIDRQIAQTQAEISSQQAAANKVCGVAFVAAIFAAIVAYSTNLVSSNAGSPPTPVISSEGASASDSSAPRDVFSEAAESDSTNEDDLQISEESSELAPLTEPEPIELPPGEQVNRHSSEVAVAGSFSSSPRTSVANWTSSVDPDVEKLIDKLILFSRNMPADSLREELKELQLGLVAAADRSTQVIELERRGDRAIALGHYEEAADLFSQVCQSGQVTAESLSRLGYAQMASGNLDGAKSNLYASISLEPEREPVWDSLALVFAKNHEQSKSVACFAIAYRLSEGRTLAYLKSLSNDKDLGVRLAADEAVRTLTDYP